MNRYCIRVEEERNILYTVQAGRKGGRKEGGKEGRREGRKEEGKE